MFFFFAAKFGERERAIDQESHIMYHALARKYLASLGICYQQRARVYFWRQQLLLLTPVGQLQPAHSWCRICACSSTCARTALIISPGFVLAARISDRSCPHLVTFACSSAAYSQSTVFMNDLRLLYCLKFSTYDTLRRVGRQAQWSLTTFCRATARRQRLSHLSWMINKTHVFNLQQLVMISFKMLADGDKTLSKELIELYICENFTANHQHPNTIPSYDKATNNSNEIIQYLIWCDYWAIYIGIQLSNICKHIKNNTTLPLGQKK